MYLDDFNRIFNPSKEQLISDLECMIELHNSLVGRCVTCAHHIPPAANLPGFIDACGICTRVDRKVFLNKAILEKDMPCDQYENDERGVNAIQNEIDRLKGEK